MTSKLPKMEPGEVAITVNVAVPNALFKRPQIQASISIPENAVTASVLDATVLDNVREVLEQQTGFDVKVSLIEPAA
ncbi:MAG TPA: hypothetical protein VJ476_05920 [Rhizomicrobium sp.]|nr:hypothetical protein [Rhizomicrobium sp.]